MSDKVAVRRPFGVTALTVITLVNAFHLFLGFLWCLAVSARLDDPIVQDALGSATSPWIAENASTLFFFLGLGEVALFVSYALLARGYYNGREEARIRGRKVAKWTIAFALLCIILVPARADPGSPWFTLFLNLGIFHYLGKDRVIAYFRARKQAR